MASVRMWFPLPVSAAISSALVMVGSAGAIRVGVENALILVLAVGQAITTPVSCLVQVLHARRALRTRRRLKYELGLIVVLNCVTPGAILLVVATAGRLASAVRSVGSSASGMVGCLVFSFVVVWLTPLALTGRLLTWAAESQTHPAPQLSRWFHQFIARSVSAVAAAVLIAHVMPILSLGLANTALFQAWANFNMILFTLVAPYSIARYVLIESFKKHPILYLRSFADESGLDVFRSHLGPLLSYYGVVIALGDSHEAGDTLNVGASVTTRVFLEWADDDEWRTQIAGLLAHAEAVIIDVTNVTNGLEWELAEARTAVPPSSLLLVADPQIASDRARELGVAVRPRIQAPSEALPSGGETASDWLEDRFFGVRG